MKYFKYILFSFLICISLTYCKTDANNSFDIIGTKWNTIDSVFGLDKTIVFEINGSAYMVDKVIGDEPIEYMGETYNKGELIYTYYTYTFDNNTGIGELEAIEEYMLGCDFYILLNGHSMLIKNDAIEQVYSKI